MGIRDRGDQWARCIGKHGRAAEAGSRLTGSGPSPNIITSTSSGIRRGNRLFASLSGKRAERACRELFKRMRTQLDGTTVEVNLAALLQQLAMVIQTADKSARQEKRPSIPTTH